MPASATFLNMHSSCCTCVPQPSDAPALTDSRPGTHTVALELGPHATAEQQAEQAAQPVTTVSHLETSPGAHPPVSGSSCPTKTNTFRQVDSLNLSCIHTHVMSPFTHLQVCGPLWLMPMQCPIWFCGVHWGIAKSHGSTSLLYVCNAHGPWLLLLPCPA